MPLSVGCGLPLDPLLGHCYARSAASTPTGTFTAVASAPHSQPPTAHGQLQLSSARLHIAHILCPAIQCSNSRPPTLLWFSAALVRHLGNLKGGISSVLLFKKNFLTHVKNEKQYYYCRGLGLCMVPKCMV